MRYFIAYILFLFTCKWQNVRAQGVCTGANNIVLESITHPIASETVKYKTAPTIDEFDIPFTDDLYFRVSYPTDLAPNEKRPLVILIHGGFFIAGSYDNFSSFADEYARAGFVAATVGYRLCKRGDCLLAGATSYPCSVSWANSLLPSAYAATVDVGDAIRYLQQHATQYHIDPNSVIVSGHSAGALTALHLAYLDADEITAVCPGCGTWPDYLAQPLQPVSGIKVVVPMSGMLLDVNWIDADEANNIDAFIMHGTNDGITPYDYEEAVECCSGMPFLNMYGACPIAERLNNFNGSYELFTAEGCTHDVSSFYDLAKVELVGFITKTLICGQTVRKHAWYSCNPGPVCPGFPYEPGNSAQVCSLPQDDWFNVAVAGGVGTNTPIAKPQILKAVVEDQTLQLNWATAALVRVQITDMSGKTWYNQTHTSADIVLNISGWAKGFYLVSLFDSQYRLLDTQKVAKL